LGQFFGIGIIKPLPIIRHAFGDITERARAIVPESEWKKMIWSSRLWLLGYALIIASCFYFGTILPLVFTLFARFYGAFIPTMLNDTQHVGLAEDVYDHRLCSRNVYYGPIMSFIYWNMQYHIEHHMYPGIPFHSLRKAHLLVKDQLPKPYKNIWKVYKELIPTLRRQQKESDYHVLPTCPDEYPACPEGVSAGESAENTAPRTKGSAVPEGLDSIQLWLEVAKTAALVQDDVMPFRHEGKQYAIYRISDGYYASSGKCTHAGALLSKGLVIDGKIECPAHQGRFDIKTGKATDSPACDQLEMYPVREIEGSLYIGLPK
jgi:Na+-transporting NADH:ubiquinone oxidoreductase subunit F